MIKQVPDPPWIYGPEDEPEFVDQDPEFFFDHDDYTDEDESKALDAYERRRNDD
jgi:hypothetical protein